MVRNSKNTVDCYEISGRVCSMAFSNFHFRDLKYYDSERRTLGITARLLCLCRYPRRDVFTGKGYIKQIPADIVEFSTWKITTERIGLVSPEFISGIINLCIVVSTTPQE